jgi:hypothetical protein
MRMMGPSSLPRRSRGPVPGARGRCHPSASLMRRLGLAPVRSGLHWGGGESRVTSPWERSGAGVMMRA